MTAQQQPQLGSAVDSVRRRNLSLILRLVHESGTMARSALTRSTGLNRSTIGALTAELIALGLVKEGSPAAAKTAGRPSPTITAASNVVAIAVHPEIDRLTVSLIGLDGTEHRRIGRRFPRIPTPQEAIDATVGILAELEPGLRGHRVAGLGVAIPGIVRVSDGLVRVAPHLGWREIPFADLLANATGRRVVASNDALLGVRAEQLGGSARGSNNVVYINGGASGIGGAIIADGAVLGGRGGYAGEIGHTFVDSAAAPCHCGSTGCLETVVSQSALLRAAGLHEQQPDQDLSDGERLAAALDRPSATLEAEVNSQLDFLAIAIRNVIVTVSPDVIVLGGFLGLLHDHAAQLLHTKVERQTFAVLGEGVEITRTSLGSSILLRGAAELVFAEVLADPAGDWERARTAGPL